MTKWVQCQLGKCRKVYDLQEVMTGRNNRSMLQHYTTPCCGISTYRYDAMVRELTPAEVEAIEHGWGHLDDRGRATVFEVVRVG